MCRARLKPGTAASETRPVAVTLSSSLRIAVSGLEAGQRRLEASARNVANVSTPGYVPVRTVETAERRGGVSGRLERAEGPGGLPSGDGAAPGDFPLPSGVDIGFETVQQSSALRSYAANLRVLEAADEMLGTLVQTKR